MVRIRTFRHAPPEKRRTTEQIEREREVVARQIRRWLATIQGKSIHQLTETSAEFFKGRRAGTTLPQFEEDGDSGALVVSGRLLVRGDPIDRSVQKELSDEFGLHEIRIPGLPDLRALEEVVAVDKPNLRDRIGSVADQLRSRKLDTAPVHMIPLGGIRKAEGGPEPSGPPQGEEPWPKPDAEVRGPRVAIVDTGVSAEQRTDDWLRGLARTDNLDLLNVLPVDDYLDQGAGHGQFGAGIIQQIAPGADIDVRRGLDTDGLGDELEIARLITEAVNADAKIVNLSLGTVTAGDRPPYALESAVRAARAKGALLVCAAGNYGDERKVWPAAFHAEPGFERTVVSVAALRRGEDDDDAVGADWSSRGDWVECSTFGEGVVSTFVIGAENPEQDKEGPDVFGPDSWATWSGTSFAAPQIVGAIVRLMQDDGNLSPRDALDELLKDGTDIPLHGRAIKILPV